MLYEDCIPILCGMLYDPNLIFDANLKFDTICLGPGGTEEAESNASESVLV